MECYSETKNDRGRPFNKCASVPGGPIPQLQSGIVSGRQSSDPFARSPGGEGGSSHSAVSSTARRRGSAADLSEPFREPMCLLTSLPGDFGVNKAAEQRVSAATCTYMAANDLGTSSRRAPAIVGANIVSSKTATTQAADPKEWQALWHLFDELERTWCPSRGGSQTMVATLRQLFVQLADLEVRLKNKDAHTFENRKRHVGVTSSSLMRWKACEEFQFHAQLFSYWRLETTRSKVRYFDDRLKQAAASTKHAGRAASILEESHALRDRGHVRVKGHRVLAVWRLWAKSNRQLDFLSMSCLARARTARHLQEGRTLNSVLGLWQRCAVAQARETASQQMVANQEVLKGELQYQKGETTSLEGRLQALSDKHFRVREQCIEAWRTIRLWRDVCSGGVTNSVESAVGSESAGATASLVPENIVADAADAGAWRLVMLCQERQDLVEELGWVEGQATPLATRIDVALKAADSLRFRVARGTGAPGDQFNDSLASGMPRDEQAAVVAARDLDAAAESRQHLELELEQLQLRKTRLRNSLRDVDREIEVSNFGPERQLQKELHDVQVHIEKTLGAERYNNEQLREQLARAQHEADHIKAHHDVRQQQWEHEMSTMCAKLRNEVDTETSRANSLEEHLLEAQAWVDHLKLISEKKSRSERKEIGQDSQLFEIKEALSDLADINAQFFGARRLKHSPAAVSSAHVLPGRDLLASRSLSPMQNVALPDNLTTVSPRPNQQMQQKDGQQGQQSSHVPQQIFHQHQQYLRTIGNSSGGHSNGHLTSAGVGRTVAPDWLSSSLHSAPLGRSQRHTVIGTADSPTGIVAFPGLAAPSASATSPVSPAIGPQGLRMRSLSPIPSYGSAGTGRAGGLLQESAPPSLTSTLSALTATVPIGSYACAGSFAHGSVTSIPQITAPPRAPSPSTTGPSSTSEYWNGRSSSDIGLSFGSTSN